MLWIFTLLLSCTVATSALADSDLLLLSELLGDADVVVRGTVASVADGVAPGDKLATLDVERVFAGSYTGTVIVTGSTLDPELHAFVPGEKVLAFLVETPSGPGSHEAVGGLSGVVELVAGTESGADGLVAAAVAAGSTFGLPDASPFLRLPNPAPRMLVAATLEDLTAAVGPADHAEIVAKACDTTGFELPSVRLWAVERLGALDPVGGRSCLRSIVAGAAASLRGGNRAVEPLAMSAVMAVGTIGNRDETAAALGGLLDLSLKDRPADVGCKVAPAYLDELLLAAGKSGNAEWSGKLYKASRKFPDLGVGSSVVNSLGAIGDAKADRQLVRLAARHPEPLVRQQATATLQRSRSRGVK